jgi:threonine/homoserine/homoserine lactone efflux protein
MFTLEFLITSFIVVLAPGTGVVYTVSTGIVQGRRASLFAALGCTAGIIPHLLATVFGLAAVMHTSALAFSVLKYAGVAYLFYVGVLGGCQLVKDLGEDVNHQSVSNEYPEPKTHHIFLSLPAAVCECHAVSTLGAFAALECGVYADDVCRVRSLWVFGARLQALGDGIC